MFKSVAVLVGVLGALGIEGGIINNEINGIEIFKYIMIISITVIFLIMCEWVYNEIRNYKRRKEVRKKIHSIIRGGTNV